MMDRGLISRTGGTCSMEFGVRRLVGATYAETPQVVSEAHLPPRRLPGVVSGVWSNRLMI